MRFACQSVLFTIEAPFLLPEFLRSAAEAEVTMHWKAALRMAFLIKTSTCEVETHVDGKRGVFIVDPGLYLS